MDKQAIKVMIGAGILLVGALGLVVNAFDYQDRQRSKRIGEGIERASQLIDGPSIEEQLKDCRGQECDKLQSLQDAINELDRIEKSRE